MSEGRSKDRTLDERVARLNELEASSQPMLDAVIPGQERKIYLIIGKGASQDRDAKIQIFDNAGFNVAITRCAPGKSRLHHDHRTNEVFTALTGKMENILGRRRRQSFRHSRALRYRLGAAQSNARFPQCRR